MKLLNIDKLRVFYTNAKLKVQMRLASFKAKLFALTQYSVKNMCWLFYTLLIAYNVLAISIEYIIFGEKLDMHIIDTIFGFIITVSWLYYISALGDFLLDITLNAEKVDK